MNTSLSNLYSLFVAESNQTELMWNFEIIILICLLKKKTHQEIYLSVELSHYFASFHHLSLKIDVPAHISFTCVLNKTEMAINHHEGRVGGEK